jgi:hypothetical protein
MSSSKLSGALIDFAETGCAPDTCKNASTSGDGTISMSHTINERYRLSALILKRCARFALLHCM